MNEAQKEKSYTKGYINMPWKRLEFEEQCHARSLMRRGLAKFEGERPNFKVVLTAEGQAWMASA